MDKVTCPMCNSSRIAHIRIYADTGSGCESTLSLVNAGSDGKLDTCYTKRDIQIFGLQEGPEIEGFICLSCSHGFNMYMFYSQ